MKRQRARTIGLSLLMDVLLGDPPNRFHPVAWMGSLISWANRKAPAKGITTPFLFGGVFAVGGAAAVYTLGACLEKGLTRLPFPLDWFLEAYLLKTTLALRGLSSAGREVEEALKGGDLSEARRRLSWHLVSRNTSLLDESQVAAAAIESIAENTSDGIIAPLFFYTLAGLPGAMVYRFINTADAMLGYHDPIHEWLGKVPARLDDLTNLLPSRLTAALLCLACWLSGGNIQSAVEGWRRDAGKTASPNAGHPMSAMAGALNLRLEKVGHYRLGAGNRKPEYGDIPHSIRLMGLAALLGAALMMVFSLLGKGKKN